MKRPSFQFYGDGFTGTKWLKIDHSEGVVPRMPACYVIYLDGVLSYVGQTLDLAKRLSAHGIRLGYGVTFTKWGQFKSVSIKARFGVRLGDWAMREVRLISRLQPPLNILLLSGKRASK
jgi:hypothetical protein